MKTACVCIDIQNDYFPGGANELVQAEEAGLCASEIIKSARNQNIPVIHIQHISTRPGSTFFLPGTRGVQIHPLVEPLLHEEVVTKQMPNSFSGTSLESVLARLEISQLILCGMMTHMCVDTTVRAAADRGYRCILASDACATKNLVWEGIEIPAATVQATYLASLSGLFAEIKPIRDIISYMTQVLKKPE